MRNLPFRRTQRPKSNKIIPCKTNSGPPAVLTGKDIKLPCIFEAVREIYRNIFGFASFEKVDRFRSENQLAGHPVRGLTRMQQRPKCLLPTKNFQVNDLCLIKDDNLAPTRWKMGRIVQLHPGLDNKVRVVNVKT
ncbi:integrase catalytic domain-containing protein [Trichonephila clavipes]|nr:integrase catalytic domain-containing protein [Trichonephila clavipes]